MVTLDREEGGPSHEAVGGGEGDSPRGWRVVARAIGGRAAAVLMSILLARLIAWGVEGLPPELAAGVHRGVGRSCELLVPFGYWAIRPMLRARSGLSGAITVEATLRVDPPAGAGERHRERTVPW